MYQVHITPVARKQLQNFIRNHNEFLIENFYDTGLASEEQIRERYIREGIELGAAIYDYVIEKSGEEIFPYEVLDGGYKLSVIRFGQRRVFVYYTESQNVREIFRVQIFHR